MVHNYLHQDGKVIKERFYKTDMFFYYDQDGAPYAMRINNTLYYYITNLQGDVVALVDGNGTTVATYQYDPYGKILSSSGIAVQVTVSNTLTTTGYLDEINPLRYRGYYYDQETGLYYLLSRYYDPNTGRFINADAFTTTGQGFLGNNMFAYCNNNPTNRVDYAGERPVVCCVGAIALPIPIPIPIPYPLPDFFDKLNDVANDVKAWVESQKGIKEYRDNSVYVLRDPNDNNLVKYVGRTNDPGRRKQEHRNDLAHPWRKDYQMDVLVTGLTKNEAMMWEQFLISAYTVTYLENARREIAVKNVPKFKSYAFAVTEIYTGIPGSDVYDFMLRR